MPKKKEEKKPKKIEKSAPEPKSENRTLNFGRLFIGLIVVLVGIFYLARNYGWIPPEWDIQVWQLWPILIIFAGLSFLTARSWAAAIIGVLVVLVVLLFVGLLMFYNIDERKDEITETPFIIEKEADIDSARIEIRDGAGRINIAGGTPYLIEGSLRTNFMDLYTSSRADDRVQKVDIDIEGRWNRFFGNRENFLDMKLNSETPLELFVNSGASDMNFDLSEVRANVVDIDTGASTLDIVLGDLIDRSRLKINAGASTITVMLPQNVGAEMDLDTGVSARDLDGFDKVDEGKYRSTNYNDVDKFYDIDMDLGVSNLNFEWYNKLF